MSEPTRNEWHQGHVDAGEANPECEDCEFRNPAVAPFVTWLAPGMNVQFGGHLFVHVAACECPETQREVARLAHEPSAGAAPHLARCDEPGCMEQATCGWPSDAGYRSGCGDHYQASLSKGTDR